MFSSIISAITGGGGDMKRASVLETADAVKGDVQFIDVRTVGEYNEVHAKGVKNLPLDTLAENLDGLDKSKPTYVICKSGMRSQRGSSILLSAGFTDVYNVEGGTMAWLSSGLPAE